MAVLQGAKERKCSKIIAIDINPSKFEMAKKMGATDCVNPKDYPDKKIQEVIVEVFFFFFFFLFFFFSSFFPSFFFVFLFSLYFLPPLTFLFFFR